MSSYQTKDGKIAYVAKAPFTGDFTFYILATDKPNQRGTRVKGRSKSLYFPTKADAEIALSEYAKKRGWSPCLTG